MSLTRDIQNFIVGGINMHVRNLPFDSARDDLEAYRFVTINHTAGTVNYTAAAAAADAVTLARASKIGDIVHVKPLSDTHGSFFFTAEGAIARGAEVEVGTDGKGVTIAAGVAACRAKVATAGGDAAVEGYNA